MKINIWMLSLSKNTMNTSFFKDLVKISYSFDLFSVKTLSHYIFDHFDHKRRMIYIVDPDPIILSFHDN